MNYITTFGYNGNETFTFSGDDNVWDFINRRLAVDIGGVHGSITRLVDLSNATTATNLGITSGNN